MNWLHIHWHKKIEESYGMSAVAIFCQRKLYRCRCGSTRMKLTGEFL